MKVIIKAALRVAKQYPVFPTNDKMPCWSNKELGVKKGEGGYKIATQDPERVIELFSHPRATEIAVPMGAMSGLLCVDVDAHKDPELFQWIKDNPCLEKTRWHRTRSGGYHFFFRHPGDNIRFPATLRPGVDLKAGGNGYVCWPGTKGYTLEGDLPIADFHMPLLKAAMLAKGGSGNVTLDSYNEAADEELIERIEAGTELYPALRSLSYRMPGRRQPDGSYMTEPEMVNILENVMDTSIAADPASSRHDDWLDRRGKIGELVSTAIEKEAGGAGLTDAELEAISRGESFIEAQLTIAKGTRPIGPQQEVSLEQIEVLVAALGGPTRPVATPKKEKGATQSSNTLVKLNARKLRSTTIPPIEYIIPSMMSVGGTCSLAGMSNVGKTRFMAAMVMALAVGDTKRMGLPQCTGRISSMYVANEEHTDDMARRFAAVCYQHDDKDSADIFVRGKKAGTFRLVAINERGHPEVDADNVAWLVKEIREAEVKVLVLDPYVTLAEGGDENSSSMASMVTKAFLLIIAATDVCIFYPHHTPKGDRKADRDWPRGDSSAWRGSGAIYSSLDYGFTLANWYPANGEHKKQWKQQYLNANLSRFIVLDTGKIREGNPIDPVVMELVPQEMDEGEGDPIGVCKLIDEAQAMNALLDEAIDTIAATELANAMITTIGEGEHRNMTALHRMMEGHQLWQLDLRKTPGKTALLGMFGDRYMTTSGAIHVTCIGTGSGAKWCVTIEESD